MRFLTVELGLGGSPYHRLGLEFVSARNHNRIYKFLIPAESSSYQDVIWSGMIWIYLEWSSIIRIWKIRARTLLLHDIMTS